MNKNTQNAQNATENTQNAQNAQNTENIEVVAQNATQNAQNAQTAKITIPTEYNNLASISASIEYLNSVQNNVDYAKSIMYYALSKLDSSVFTALNVSYEQVFKKKDGTTETKTVNVDNYTKYCYYRWNDSQSYVSKMVRVADRFMKTTDNALIDSQTFTDDEGEEHTLTVAKIGANTVDVTRKDKYGFRFTLSALSEMLRFTDEQLETAIEEDIIDSSTPSMKVRTLLEKRFAKTVDTTATVNGNGEGGNGEGGNGEGGNTVPDNYTVEKTDLSRLTVIQTILNSMSDEFKNTHVEQMKTLTKTISLAINEMTK